MKSVQLAAVLFVAGLACNSPAQQVSVLVEEQVEEVVAMLRDVCGNFAEKGTGIVFTLPVSNFVGPV